MKGLHLRDVKEGAGEAGFGKGRAELFEKECDVLLTVSDRDDEEPGRHGAAGKDERVLERGCGRDVDEDGEEADDVLVSEALDVLWVVGERPEKVKNKRLFEGGGAVVVVVVVVVLGVMRRVSSVCWVFFSWTGLRVVFSGLCGTGGKVGEVDEVDDVSESGPDVVLELGGCDGKGEESWVPGCG